uniref:Reverse transcriptase domain-containing protein n=1 Tax=Tanacetum cinerariifolium TaxID=118510 RepID=A0A699L925_TANCI|nr:reverse transcriptase domain-containing protein [Tanacetum cinerariifolium]
MKFDRVYVVRLRYIKRIRLKQDKFDQNRTKREAWRSPEKSRAVSVDRARKTEENAKRMVKNANTKWWWGGSLSDKGRTELCSLLKRNLDIFAWQPSDMTGVPRSIAKHRLNVREGCPPVRQKKRGQAPERTKAIQAEVKKLVEAGIMREVYYHDWLSNPVMIKKHDGSWRMCVDFTDLNKARPQDCYPLSEIDWMVESLCGYPFKCFLDAYKGYHQIQMAAADEEKTAFHTGQGVYCYTKMPLASKTLVSRTSD